MWTTLTLLTLTAAPAQVGTPEFKNVRYTYGLLGQVRKSDKFLPGDAVFLAFDVDNMTVGKNGQVRYAMGMEVTKQQKGGKDKNILTREPQDLEVTNTLGGGTFPSFATWTIPHDSESPGQYTLKVTVKDRATGKTTPLTRKFEVLSSQLGFIHVYLTSLRGDPVPPVAVTGQRMYLRYTLTGFAFDKKQNPPQCNVTVSIRILDASGKPTLVEPFKGDIKGDEKSAPGVMVLAPFLLELNRPGKFKVEVKATDNVAGKTTEHPALELDIKDNK